MSPTESGSSSEPSSSTSSAKKDIKTVEAKPIGNFPSIDAFTKHGLSEIMEATKRANAFPQGTSRDLYCAFPAFGKIIDQQSDDILGLISKVLKWQNVKGNIQRRQQDEQFEMLCECNDTLLERVNTNLDEWAGLKKPTKSTMESVDSVAMNHPSTSGPSFAKFDVGRGAGSWNTKSKNDRIIKARLISSKNIQRPQINFKIPVDNKPENPFMPKIKEKPNSLKPLAILPEYDEFGNVICYLHPYEFELDKFEVPEKQLQRKAAAMPKDINKTEVVMVDTIDKLKTALDEMRQFTELAVDVEHHSYRSFLGFTCLVQVSTRQKDYLFDALKLREDMHILNEVFTNPKVVKILHGSSLDIEWLQRDLGVYIVNMFDTYLAAKSLNLSRLSLAFLLLHFCGVEADKTYQLADWRVRPLPAELLFYARQDTHYLIYIYERLCNDVLDASNQKTNLLRSIYQKSTELCKRRYIKPITDDKSHLDVFRKSKRVFDNRQMYALREIFQWRDSIAREEDESFGYVLPNHMMVQIAESLPREMQGIMACCNPVPPLVRVHIHTLHQIILKAREQPLVKPVFERERYALNSQSNETNNNLYHLYDTSQEEEFRDDLPCLLKFKNLDEPPVITKKEESLVKINFVKTSPALGVFGTMKKLPEDKKFEKKKVSVLLPFQRYLAVLPLVEKENLEEAERIATENKRRRLCPSEPLLPVKKEQITQDEMQNAKAADDGDIYTVPVKAMRKRKYEEDVARRFETNADSSINFPSPKRSKQMSQAQVYELKFINLPPTKKERKEAASASTKYVQEANVISVGHMHKSHLDNTSHKQEKMHIPKEDTINEVMEIVPDSDNGNVQDGTQNVPTTSTKVVKPNGDLKKQNNLKRLNNKNRYKIKNNKTYQGSDKPVTGGGFDYKSVDFKKFGGGAKHAQSAELKPKFHGKGNKNKAHNKQQSKLFSFSNVKSGKK